MVNVIGSLKKHVERQQSENREARASAASVKEEDHEEELNVEESSSAGGDDIVQPSNDVTGDAGNLCAVLAATTNAIPTSEVAGDKKRSRDATSSTRNASKKRVKLPQSTLHETSEVAGTTAQTPVLRRSARSASTNAREGTFEGTSRGVEAEEADADLMPNEEPLDDGDDDYDDDDGKRGVVAKGAHQGRGSKHKSFDERLKDLMDFQDKFGHCNVPKMKSGKYQSFGGWCTSLRVAYKKIQNGETPNHKLTQDNIRQLEDAGFQWILSTRSAQQGRPAKKSFDERLKDLMDFKDEFGHCNVPQNRSGEYWSLGGWCDKVRESYKKIRNRETPNNKLTEDNIRQLEDAGFKWSLR